MDAVDMSYGSFGGGVKVTGKYATTSENIEFTIECCILSSSDEMPERSNDTVPKQVTKLRGSCMRYVSSELSAKKK